MVWSFFRYFILTGEYRKVYLDLKTCWEKCNALFQNQRAWDNRWEVCRFFPLDFTGGISLFSFFLFCLYCKSLVCLNCDFSLKYFLSKNIASCSGVTFLLFWSCKDDAAVIASSCTGELWIVQIRALRSSWNKHLLNCRFFSLILLQNTKLI